MEIDIFFVKEKVLAKELNVYHITAINQWIDALAKPRQLGFSFLGPNST